jgi:predicted membrane channel-forming protein YqfA (hemolysin III family)
MLLLLLCFVYAVLCRKMLIRSLSSIIAVAVWPMLYQAFVESMAASPTKATRLVVATALVMQSGGQLSAAQLPEKLAPGAFDLIGASHQLMHVAMWAAHVLQYLFVWEICCRATPCSAPLL